MKRSRSNPVLLVVELPVAAVGREQLVVRAPLDDLAVPRARGSGRRSESSTAGGRSRTSSGRGAATAGRPGSAPRSRCRGSRSPRRAAGCAGSRGSRARSRPAAAVRPTAGRRARPRPCRSRCSNPAMNSSACAILATRSMSARVAFGDAVRDVLGDRAVEQEVVLQHDAEVPAVIGEAQRREVRPSTRIAPARGRLNAMTRLMSVLFPEPDEPDERRRACRPAPGTRWPSAPARPGCTRTRRPRTRRRRERRSRSPTRDGSASSRARVAGSRGSDRDRRTLR